MAEDRTDQDVFKAAADKTGVFFVREDQDSIRSLAEELHQPLDLVAEVYGRELARLRPSARVTTFLPLLPMSGAATPQ